MACDTRQCDYYEIISWQVEGKLIMQHRWWLMCQRERLRWATDSNSVFWNISLCQVFIFLPRRRHCCCPMNVLCAHINVVVEKWRTSLVLHAHKNQMDGQMQSSGAKWMCQKFRNVSEVVTINISIQQRRQKTPLFYFAQSARPNCRFFRK